MTRSGGMKAIWKFPLEIVDVQHVQMPAGARVLSVQVQHGSIHLWALVDPNASLPVEQRNFWVIGTGHHFDGRLDYIGTVQIGAFVWHVFEALK